MAEQKPKKEKVVKTLAPMKITKGREWKHDGVINDIRVKLNIPLNRELLKEIATDAYIESKKGNLDAIAAPIRRIKLDKEEIKLMARLEAIQKQKNRG